LAKLVTRVSVRRVWHAHLSGEAPKLREGLAVQVDGERLFAASHSGAVEAFDVTTGRRLWRRRVRAPLSGGPGQGGLAVVFCKFITCEGRSSDASSTAEKRGRWYRSRCFSVGSLVYQS